MRSLIVEDEFTSRMQIKYFLDEYGSCDIAVNGLEAIEAYKMAIELQKPYDLICLDIEGYELAALYGCIRPYDGRKLYATIERAMYGDSVLAPCFQPSPTSHALGGDINRKDVF